LFAPEDCFVSWKQVCRRYGAFETALRRTERFAAGCVSKTTFGVPIFPGYGGSDSDAQQRLRTLAYRGAQRRYGVVSDAVAERLEYELALIGRKQFAPYFLIVRDIVSQSPRTCGRGSGAASIVAYSLGITNVDPLRYGLMFERFLNPGRTDPPDIDIDFAWDERDGVLDYVFKKYGTEHAALVATHQTFNIRMALREVARVYGFTEGEIGTVTKKIPFMFAMPEKGDLEHALRSIPRAVPLALDPPWPDIIAVARKLLGTPRGIGTHCGGTVITPGPIRRAAPVQFSAKGYQIVQWEKDGAEEMGLVKIDLLGNRSLAVIRDAVGMVRKEGGVFDERCWDPASDSATVQTLASGKTIGVFYVESPAMRLLQQKTGRGDFEHLVIHSSIIRPAANRYIKEYIRRLNGAPYTVEHPVLAQVLEETFGIMVYQEDVAKVAMALAGFGFEEADELRKIMAKKSKRRRLEDVRQRFYDGARARGVQRKTIEAVWKMMRSFSGYSFCKPHSASYVQVSFQSAYLKTHYPAAFMASVLRNYGGFYTTQAYVSEARRMEIAVEGVDINESVDTFIARTNTIRVGLLQVKGLSAKAAKRIIEERANGGSYRSLDDCLQRCGIEEADAERLVAAGAFDRCERGVNRAQQYWKLRAWYHSGTKNVPFLPPHDAITLLRQQYRLLGFLTGIHPLTLCIPENSERTVFIADLPKYRNRRVRLYGWCVTSRTVVTLYGENMQFVSFEDESGICETVLFPDVYKEFTRFVTRHEAYRIEGRVVEEFGVCVVEVNRLEPLR
jgi:DNA polymerase-3 subunit alpha/error-prone DNA polymerase